MSDLKGKMILVNQYRLRTIRDKSTIILIENERENYE